MEGALSGNRASFWRRNRWLLWAASGLLGVLAVLAATLAVLAHRAEPFLRARIVAALSGHFHARVELDSFHIALGNGLRGEWGVWAEGRGLRIWPPAQVEGVAVPGVSQPEEPLIRLDEFRFHAPLRYQPGTPVHISQVQLKGLDIHLPPKSHFQHLAAGNPGAASASQSGAGAPLISFQLDSVECNGAQLVVETSKPGKLPQEIAISRFRLTGITPGGAMNFDADLTNPRPRGAVHTVGSFGPWQVADPGESPITGDYRLDHADLASFSGIAGTLNSTGRFQGTLRELAVDGETDTPDFQLSHFGSPLPLHTRFHAKVDGTDGDTWLESVDAVLGRAHFTVQGQVVRVIAAQAGVQPHSIGHDIALTVNVQQARVEDFERLFSHGSTPLVTGDVTVKAALHIPPGTAPVHERLQLNGRFALDEAQFTSAKIQNRVDELSLRGQGRPGDLKSTQAAGVQSHMQGDFQMAGGVVTLPNLDYTVPGADIQLKGTYGVEDGALDFLGTAKTQATVSQMVGGWKGFLLKPADRFFKKDGAGTEIPVHISGTRQDPNFGIDLNRMKSTSPARPGEPQ